MTTDAPADPGHDPGAAIPEIDPSAPLAQPRPAPRWAAPLAGLLAAALAVGAGAIVASVVDVLSPLDAVGSEFIDHTPHWMKVWAVQTFGTNDKTALRVGMWITIALLALVVGAVARRRRIVGVVAIALFGVVGAFVAAGRPDGTGGAAVPPLLGAVLGAGLVWYLLGLVAAADPAREVPGPSRAPRGWDRRRFLVASGSTAVATGVLVAISRRVDDQRVADARSAAPDSLPPVAGQTPSAPAGGGAAAVPVAPAGAQVIDETPFITPNDDFYLIDTALSLPRADLSTWKLRIGGMVTTPLSFSYDELLARPMVERTITIACVSNEVGGEYIGNAVWQGVLLRDLLAEAGVNPQAEQVFGTSLDGWTCGFPVAAAMDGRDALVAIGMNGQPLPLEHGFPARVIVPGLYGYVSATKWLSQLELKRWSDAVGYWVPRGWAREAPIKTQSRIDVPRKGAKVVAGTVALGGVAWAQHRGVAKVEVRVDEGEWQQAELGTDVSDDAWRQWKFAWQATPGKHVVQVRATDKTGATQTEQVARPDPDGATGYHTRTITVG